jgi:hypothetical protein
MSVCENSVDAEEGWLTVTPEEELSQPSKRTPAGTSVLNRKMRGNIGLSCQKMITRTLLKKFVMVRIK